MTKVTLSPGQKLTIKNNVHVIERYVSEDELQLIEVKTKRATQQKLSELLGKINNGDIGFLDIRPSYIPEYINNKKGEKVAAFLEFYTEAQRECLKVKRQFLEQFLKSYGDIRSQIVIKDALNKLWKSEWGDRPHPATAARWMKRYIEAGKDIRSLGSADFLKGNRSQRYDEFVKEACISSIEKIYLTREKGSLDLTLVDAVEQIRVENMMRSSSSQLCYPTKTYLRSLIDELPKYDVCVAREGLTVAKHRFRDAIHSVLTERPLERVEIDHTLLDICIVDHLTGLPIGRPWLTLVIDVNSKSILGFSLSFDPPSHMTIARALKMALMPKVNLKARWPSIKGNWDMFGVMLELVVDNGLEFHGDSLENACLQLGIEISFCPRKRGWWKATVERAIGTLNRAVTDGKPGRTFSSIKEKGDYKPTARAIMPLATMEEMIAKWIVDVYHETVHRTLGKKPKTAWVEGISITDIPIVTNINELDAVMGVYAKRKLTHKGIEINNLRYHSDELGEVRQRYGVKQDVTVKWNPEDMGYIYVLPKNGESIKVPVVTAYEKYAAGISHYQHKHCMEYAKTHLDENDDVDALHQAKIDLLELGVQGSKEVKKNRRIYQARIKQKSSVKTVQVVDPNTIQINPIDIDLENVVIPKFEVNKSNRNMGTGEHLE